MIKYLKLSLRIYLATLGFFILMYIFTGNIVSFNQWLEFAFEYTNLLCLVMTVPITILLTLKKVTKP